jgi:hypothetical protein
MSVNNLNTLEFVLAFNKAKIFNAIDKVVESDKKFEFDFKNDIFSTYKLKINGFVLPGGIYQIIINVIVNQINENESKVELKYHNSSNVTNEITLSREITEFTNKISTILSGGTLPSKNDSSKNGGCLSVFIYLVVIVSAILTLVVS